MHYDPRFSSDLLDWRFKSSFSTATATTSPVTIAVAQDFYRIKIANNIVGDSAFSFRINPDTYDPADQPNNKPVSVLYGPLIHQNKSFDGRTRKLIWHNPQIDNSKISDIVTYLKGCLGSVKYIYFGTVDMMNDRWPSTSLWKKTRIVNLEIKYKPGGTIRYDSIALIIQPEK